MEGVTMLPARNPLVVTGWFLASAVAGAQPPAAPTPVAAPEPAIVGEAFPDFSLPSLQGGRVSLSDLRGKNVLLIVPRVQYGERRWCTICNYAYAELTALEASEQFRKAYDVEVVFVVPFGREIAQAWIEATPAELGKIKSWKNPPEPENLDETQRARRERARRMFPLDLSAEPGQVPEPFPILLDADRALTSRLGVFATEWGGRKVEQGIPSVFVLDKTGQLRFRYVAQASTWDRPGSRYLLHVLSVLNGACGASASIEPATRAAIVRASLDYVEGWYLGDAARLRRALHPALAKRKLTTDERGQARLREITAQGLLDGVKVRGLGPGQSVDVTVFDVHKHMATVKIVSPLFVDYAQLVLWNGEWKITNVVWE
jgi:peroxiredoxin